MTNGEIENHKEKCKKVMLAHLTDLGYPNMECDDIMKELKDMWVKLEEAGLILEGMKFEAFAEHANHARTFSMMRDMLFF